MDVGDFVVTPDIRAWAIMMTTIVGHNGIWRLPSTPLLAYTFDKVNMRLVLLPLDAEPDEFDEIIHQKNILTFQSIGWTVEPATLKGQQ